MPHPITLAILDHPGLWVALDFDSALSGIRHSDDNAACGITAWARLCANDGALPRLQTAFPQRCQRPDRAGTEPARTSIGPALLANFSADECNGDLASSDPANHRRNLQIRPSSYLPKGYPRLPEPRWWG
jgi:hypothetical protein